MSDKIEMKSCKEYAAYIKQEVKEFMAEQPRTYTLTVISYDCDEASKVYVRNKRRVCEECGIVFENVVIGLADTAYDYVKFMDFVNKIKSTTLNAFNGGVIIQLPFPKFIADMGKKYPYNHAYKKGLMSIFEILDYKVDIDGIAKPNLLYTALNDGEYEWYTPCTPLGILKYLQWNNVELAGKHCVIVGRSELVGKPLSLLMLKYNCTVTVCHSYTNDLASITKTADILVVAAGKRNLITADMVKPGSIVIDVGINRKEDGKLCGDVDYDGVKEVAGYVTPVPGGVGVLTTAMVAYKMMLGVKRGEW